MQDKQESASNRHKLKKVDQDLQQTSICVRHRGSSPPGQTVDMTVVHEAAQERHGTSYTKAYKQANIQSKLQDAGHIHRHTDTRRQEQAGQVQCWQIILSMSHCFKLELNARYVFRSLIHVGMLFHSREAATEKAD